MWKFLKRNRQPIVYLLCSLVTTLGEMLLGWVILKLLPERIVVANTVSLILGGFVHYHLTTRYAFRMKHTAVGAAAYAATFCLGLVVQDVAVYLLYHKLLDALGEGLQYLLSKLISMLLNLVVTYFLRDWINRRIQEHAQKKAQKK